MDLVRKKDYEKLYLVASHGGHYQNATEFADGYTNTVAAKFEEDYWMYRYFDSIHVIEDVSTADLKVVKLEIAIQSSTYAKIFALLNENGIWKIDYQHLLSPETKKIAYPLLNRLFHNIIM
ncbi:MAG: hypothetical protein ABS949_11145 [Solibacillus sp.]